MAIASGTAIGGIARCESRISREPALNLRKYTAFELSFRSLSINYHQQRTEARPALALPVTQLLEAYGPWNRPWNRQLTQLEGNLSNLIGAAIGILRVLI